jgi:hypothetical protein
VIDLYPKSATSLLGIESVVVCFSTLSVCCNIFLWCHCSVAIAAQLFVKPSTLFLYAESMVGIITCSCFAEGA